MTKHLGLRAWAWRSRLAEGQNKMRLHALCKNKRIIRILVIQTDLGAKI